MIQFEVVDQSEITISRNHCGPDYAPIYAAIQAAPAGKAVRITIPEDQPKFVVRLRGALTTNSRMGRVSTRVTKDKKFMYVWLTKDEPSVMGE